MIFFIEIFLRQLYLFENVNWSRVLTLFVCVTLKKNTVLLAFSKFCKLDFFNN